MSTPVVSAVDLRRIVDEREIIALTVRLARAQDSLDFVAYRACFDERVVIRQPMLGLDHDLVMSADEWTDRGLPTLAGYDVTHHRLSNHFIEVDGDTATCDVELEAFHRIVEADEVRDLIVGGRYSLGLRRIAGAWRIAQRALDVRYKIGDPTLMDRAIARSPGSARLVTARTAHDLPS